MSYIIMTDTNSDITYPFVDKYDIKMIYMPYYIDGQELFSDLARSTRTQEFYKSMRDGATPTTSLLTQAQYVDYFEPYLQAGQDILFISFSSKLSASIEQAANAVTEMAEKYPQNRVVHIDSRHISFGEALMVIRAAKLRDEGKGIDEVAQAIEGDLMNYHSWFAVDDLVYLKRGGRLSATSATFGTIMDIKPILTISHDGRIVPAAKVKGRKKAIKALLDKFEELSEDKKLVVILDADSANEAGLLQKELEDRYPGIEVLRIPVGPVICTHCGPGTIALVFPGRDRSGAKIA
ncbi:MAG: DegV family protein [Christensenellales bacterium]|jgi:DegV family protein with EDD domain